jgi:hypothetical protein
MAPGILDDMNAGRWLAIPIALVVGLLAATACSSSDGDASTPATTTASVSDQPPWGLDATPVPTSQEEMDAVLAAMPTQLDGLTGAVGGNEIGYGEGGMGEVAGSMETFLRIMTIGGQEYGEGASFIEAIIQGGGIEIEAQELDPEAPIVYVAGLTPTGDVTYASVMWADPAAPYVLLIQGTSPQQRDALVAAYEDAAATALG